jgi:hypothetical protein
MTGYPARRTTIAPATDNARSVSALPPLSRTSVHSLARAAALAGLLALFRAGAVAADPPVADSVAAQPGVVDRAQSAQGHPPYDAATDVHQMMLWIIDPAADVIWDSAGTIITVEGSQELAPTTDKGWAKVLRAAAILTEAGNLLMMPGRAAGEEWIAYSRQLVDTGKLAMQAAQARDADALFDAGGDIYQVCRGCHEQYWVKVDESQP